jgi:glutamine synthetase type III
MESLRDLDEFKDRKKEPSSDTSSNKNVLPDNTTVDDTLENELEALKKEYNDTIDMIDDKKRQVQDTVPDHLRQVLNGEVEQTLSDDTQKELDEIEYVSSLETTDDAVEYILTKCGVKSTLAGVKNIKSLEFICNERHDLNMKSDMNEVISLIAKNCRIKPQQVKKNLQNLINHADFTKTTLINLFKMPKETITPEYLLQEFIEFYQYDPEEDESEDKKEEA